MPLPGKLLWRIVPAQALPWIHSQVGHAHGCPGPRPCPGPLPCPGPQAASQASHVTLPCFGNRQGERGSGGIPLGGRADVGATLLLSHCQLCRFHPRHPPQRNLWSTDFYECHGGSPTCFEYQAGSQMHAFHIHPYHCSLDLMQYGHPTVTILPCASAAQHGGHDHPASLTAPQHNGGC